MLHKKAVNLNQRKKRESRLARNKSKHKLSLICVYSRWVSMKSFEIFG